jgi:GNAT superfamily N-acetyltransferase
MTAALTIRPLTPARWHDLVALFGPNGACGGCWCMFHRQTGPEYEAGKGVRNRRALRRRVVAGEVPGLIGYLDGEPVAWVAVEPREHYARLMRSRKLLPAGVPVWSVPCFFVRRGFRKRGLSAQMLHAAAAHAGTHGAEVVEGYPMDTTGPTPAAFAYPGVAATFVKCGFTEVARRSATRPVMRLTVGG